MNHSFMQWEVLALKLQGIEVQCIALHSWVEGQGIYGTASA
jgi:hypothetical protein